MALNRIAVVGCGGMAYTWVKYTTEREDCQIVALVDANIDAAKAMAQHYNLNCPVFTSVQDAVNAVHPNLVYDITPPDIHYSVSSWAMRAGCDVMSEKPISNDVEQAKALVRTSEETGRFYSLMQNRRYLPGIQDVRDFLKNNPLGKPGMLCADFFIGAHFDGFRKVMDNPLLLDMSVHTFDMARFLLNADAVSVYCHAFNPVGSWYEGDASALCIFEMDNGSMFSYRGSWSAEGHFTTWESDWRIQCEKGTILWDGDEKMSARIAAPAEPSQFLYDSKEIAIPRSYNARTGHEGCLDAMFEAYNNHRPAETSGTNNLNSVMMCLAAVKSAKEGRKVYLSEM